MPSSRLELPGRSRTHYLGLWIATIAAGLASRRYPGLLPDVVARYAGDVLWATMLFWLLGFLWPRVTSRRLAVAALLISYAVELSQLYRAPWIDAVRTTRGGALVLGQGFLWTDLVCYTIGIALAVGLDARLTRRQAPTPDP